MAHIEDRWLDSAGRRTKRHGKGLRWRARYRAPDGSELSESFARKIDAQNFLTTIESHKLERRWVNPMTAKTPFEEWAKTWLASRHKLGDRKRASTESVLRSHLIGDRNHGFGKTPLSQITQRDVQSWVNEMVTAGYRPSYVRGAFTLLSGILRGAVNARMIHEAPLIGIELPKLERRRERFLTESEIDRLVASFVPFYRPLVFTASWTGCSWEELAGLRQRDLDLGRANLRVGNVVTLRAGDNGKLIPATNPYPKNDFRRRTIGLSRSVVGVLRKHLDEAPDSDLVFMTRGGALLRDTNFRRRHWNPAVASAGLAPLTFHDLRHTHVALLIKYGWTEHQIIRRLGWKDGRMLHSVYGHLFPGHDEALVADLELRRRAALRTAGGDSIAR